MKLPLFELTVDEQAESFVSAIALVENPAIQSDFIAFNKVQKFALNDEKCELLGAAMIPDVPIYRTHPTGDYYCIFSKDTIRQIAQIFFKKGLVGSLNIDHSSVNADSYVFQSFITDDNIKAPTALGNLPTGTWIIGTKITSPAVWQKVKSGEVKGFSVEGIFSMLPTDFIVDSTEIELEKAVNEFNTVLKKLVY